MDVGMAITSKGGEYNGRMTFFVVLSCMIAATGGIIFGYDLGVSGGVTSMESFLKKFFPDVYTKMKEDPKISNYCLFDSQLLTLFTSSLYVAGIITSFFASSITRAFGRKPSILAGGAAFLAGPALSGAAVNLYMLILGRILLGVGIGFSNQSIPLYLSEMAPPRHRGSIGNGFLVLILVCIYVSGFSMSWGPLGYIIPSEIFPLEIRSAGQSVNVAVNFLFVFVIAQTFLAMLCHLKSGIFFFFGVWVAVMTIFVYLFLPETKNVPMELMASVWKEHWFWKRIVGEDQEVSKMEEE